MRSTASKCNVFLIIVTYLYLTLLREGVRLEGIRQRVIVTNSYLI